MIGTKYSTDVFDDAVHATAFIATVHVREGELALPQRIREHLADGPVVVHLMRGQDDVAVHTATLTSRSTLTGIEWPDDVQPRMTLTVMCPRGAASHDVGVLLPKSNVDWPDADLPAKPQPEPDADPEQEDEPEPAEPMSDREANGLAFILSELAAVEQPAVETALSGPAEYQVPTDLPVSGELEVPPNWPANEDLAAGETTEFLTAVLVPAEPDVTEDAEPGTVFSAALVAVRSQALISRQQPPRRASWLERRVREAARLVLAESHTATRVVMAVASFLVLAGTGVGFLLWEVAR
jgi:hypothetical protein